MPSNTIVRNLRVAKKEKAYQLHDFREADLFNSDFTVKRTSILQMANCMGDIGVNPAGGLFVTMSCKPRGLVSLPAPGYLIPSPPGPAWPRHGTRCYLYFNGSLFKFPPSGGRLTTSGGRAEIIALPPENLNADTVPGRQVIGMYSKVMDVEGAQWQHFPLSPTPSIGSNDPTCGCITPRFAVDAFGRLIVPNGLLQKVSLLDTAGNVITRFGTYGNIDDVRREQGKAAGTEGKFYMSSPGGTASTDDYLYVGDGANACLLQIKKNFALDNMPGLTDPFAASQRPDSWGALAFSAGPNPFNPVSTLRIFLPIASDVRLDVFDISGRRIRQLAQGRYRPGSHAFTWGGTNRDGLKAASGLYAFRFSAGNRVLIRKSVLGK